MTKGNPYSNDDDLKSFKNSKEKSNEATDDGKPHKKRDDVIELGRESENIAQKNKRLYEKIKKNRQLLKEGKIERTDVSNIDEDDSLDDAIKGLETTDSIDDISPNKTPTTQHTTNNGLKRKSTKITELLNKSDKNEDYRDKAFKLELVLQLPPKRALNALEEFFTIDVSEEMANMIYNIILDKIESGDLIDELKELTSSYMHPNGKS